MRKSAWAKFNAPLFIRFSGSLSNVGHIQDPNAGVDLRSGVPSQCGQHVRFEVEVDSHYSLEEYDVLWRIVDLRGGESSTGTSFAMTLLPRHVGQYFQILVTLTSRREWRRLGNMTQG